MCWPLGAAYDARSWFPQPKPEEIVQGAFLVSASGTFLDSADDGVPPIQWSGFSTLLVTDARIVGVCANGTSSHGALDPARGPVVVWTAPREVGAHAELTRDDAGRAQITMAEATAGRPFMLISGVQRVSSSGYTASPPSELVEVMRSAPPEAPAPLEPPAPLAPAVPLVAASTAAATLAVGAPPAGIPGWPVTAAPMVPGARPLAGTLLAATPVAAPPPPPPPGAPPPPPASAVAAAGWATLAAVLLAAAVALPPVFNFNKPFDVAPVWEGSALNLVIRTWQSYFHLRSAGFHGASVHPAVIDLTVTCLAAAITLLAGLAAYTSGAIAARSVAAVFGFITAATAFASALIGGGWKGDNFKAMGAGVWGAALFGLVVCFASARALKAFPNRSYNAAIVLVVLVGIATAITYAATRGEKYYEMPVPRAPSVAMTASPPSLA